MEINKIIEFKKLNFGDYMKPIGFTILLIVLAVLWNSVEHGILENIFNILIVGILIVLIPLNQIFRVKKIHISKICLEDDLVIYYQEILRSKIAKIPIQDADIHNLNTRIIGCRKLIISHGSFKIEQYCNNYWTNEIIEETCSKLNELKRSRSVGS